jgi:hypothetical protein
VAGPMVDLLFKGLFEIVDVQHFSDLGDFGKPMKRLFQPRWRSAKESLSMAPAGSEPRSGRGGRRFKSCHSDQYKRILLPFRHRFRPRLRP